MNFFNFSQPKCFFKQAITTIIGIYFIWHAFHPEVWIFLNNIDLAVHEAGHFIFVLLGEFIGIAGGSIMQILIPALFVFYFWQKEELWQSSTVMFWLGENILEVSFYARDAQIMSLPLIGGDGAIHDWNYLLTSLKLLPYAVFISNLIFFAGFLIIFGAIIMGLYIAGKTQDSQELISS